MSNHWKTAEVRNQNYTLKINKIEKVFHANTLKNKGDRVEYFSKLFEIRIKLRKYLEQGRCRFPCLAVRYLLLFRNLFARYCSLFFV